MEILRGRSHQQTTLELRHLSLYFSNDVIYPYFHPTRFGSSTSFGRSLPTDYPHSDLEICEWIGTNHTTPSCGGVSLPVATSATEMRYCYVQQLFVSQICGWMLQSHQRYLHTKTTKIVFLGRRQYMVFMSKWWRSCKRHEDPVKSMETMPKA